MKGPWVTYALLVGGRLQPAPGARLTPEEVAAQKALGRIETRQAKDKNTPIFQYREIGPAADGARSPALSAPAEAVPDRIAADVRSSLKLAGGGDELPPVFSDDATRALR